MTNMPKYAYHNMIGDEKRVIITEFGKSGYYSSHCTFNSIEMATAFVEQENKKLGVTKAQQEAHMVGSMFGWDVPGADPEYVESQMAILKTKN